MTKVKENQNQKVRAKELILNIKEIIQKKDGSKAPNDDTDNE